MAELATEFTKDSVYNSLRKKFNQAKGSKPQGFGFLEGDIVVATPTNFDVAGDKIQLVQFPDQCRLISASVVSDKEYDTGGSALRMGLILDDGISTNTATTAVGSAFSNQPANDSVSVHSDDAGDTTQTVTIIGTTNGTDTVVVEEIALNGTNVVDSAKLDWGVILAVKLDAACDGTVTVEENSANADIVTLATGVLSKGVNTVSGFTAYDRLLNIVASGASTKQLGIQGTDSDGTVIYDSQALAGTALVLSNSRFASVTEIYTGDLAGTTTATVTGSEALLATASQAFTALPIPLNWNGSTLPGTEVGIDVGGQTLALLVEVAPSTASSTAVTFTTKCAVYLGEVADLGTSSV